MTCNLISTVMAAVFAIGVIAGSILLIYLLIYQMREPR